MGAEGSGGTNRRPEHDGVRYGAEVRGRSVDARALLRLTFGSGARRPGARSVRDDIRPELRLVAARVHPF